MDGQATAICHRSHTQDRRAWMLMSHGNESPLVAGINGHKFDLRMAAQGADRLGPSDGRGRQQQGSRRLQVRLPPPSGFGSHAFRRAGRTLEDPTKTVHQLAPGRTIQTDPLQDPGEMLRDRTTLPQPNLTARPVQQFQIASQ